MSLPDPARAPIFVIGTGRSGTTLLRMMLSAHPRIHLSHEASFYLWEGLVGSHMQPREYLEYYLQTVSFRWLRLDPRPLLQALPRPLKRADLVAFHTAVMRAVAARHGKARFGDKTPSHSANLARIFEDYPDARVVRIVRDPRGTVRSFQRMPWAPGTIVGASTLVDLERKQTAPFRDSLHTVRLEDLIARSRDTLAGVLDFVGEAWSDQVLDHPTYGPPADEMPPVPWFQSAARRAGGPPPDWSAQDPVEIRLIEHLNRQTMREHGYEPATFHPEPSRLRVCARWWADAPEVLSTLGTTLRAASHTKDPTFPDSPLAERLFHRINPRAWDALPGFEMPTTPSLPDGWRDALS